MSKPRRERFDVHGWLIVDKPAGMTSTQAVSQAKFLFKAKKAGHAGTLDPLASGLLPIAFGEATKTVPYVMDGEKAYRFTVRWGIETNTDDAEGAAAATSQARPDQASIAAILPDFIGSITQMPPAFSALKINGERAYDLARSGETVELAARTVEIKALRLVETQPDTAVFEAECGKGTYVRALARDFGRRLGCYGHIAALRRSRVGPFSEAQAVKLDDVRAGLAEGEAASPASLLPVQAGMRELTEIQVTKNDASRLARGQAIILRGRDAPILGGTVYATSSGIVVAVGSMEQGMFVPGRVFNLGA